ncbi:hypothetical protein B0O40_2055 [Ruminococcaceae bacterium R-25]|nr:hypothetical protein B0O40_2055 [Ruminococcaceae bacterium R-25]SUQ21915.1 hypothetical protein SAMN06297423_2055 [Oscillospiraceae bacterium]
MAEKIDIGKLIDEETEKRLDIMQSPDYEFPKKAGMTDYVFICLSIIISIVLIVLCMTGVIV